MKRLLMIVLIIGLLLGGYNCNRSADQATEELTIEGRELDYDSMEREIHEEEKWIEKQKKELKEGSEPEEDNLAEDLGHNFEASSM